MHQAAEWIAPQRSILQRDYPAGAGRYQRRAAQLSRAFEKSALLRLRDVEDDRVRAAILRGESEVVARLRLDLTRLEIAILRTSADADIVQIDTRRQVDRIAGQLECAIFLFDERCLLAREHYERTNKRAGAAGERARRREIASQCH